MSAPGVTWPGALGGARLPVPRLALAPALVCLALAGLVIGRDGAPLAVDLAVRDWLTGGGSRLAEAMTQLGAGPVLYPVLLVVVWRRWRQARTPGLVALPLVALVAAQVLEGVLFVTVPRPSPSTAHAASSFSSGHAAAATLAWGLVAAHGGFSRRLTVLVAAAAGAAVGASRIALAFHWATDVAAAVAFGLCLLGVSLRVDASSGDVREDRARTPVPLSWQWLLPAAAVLAGGVSLALTPGPERLKDLLVYQGAGGVAGAGLDVYGFRTAFDMPFTYPPFAALLTEPLARMPIGAGQVLWTAATVAAAVGVSRVVLAPVVARIGLPLTVGAVLLSSPMRSHLRFGQVGIFLALIVGRDLLLPTSRVRRGLGLGLATAVKLTPAVFLPWLLVTGQRRRLRSTLAWAAGASALGLLLLWRSAADYVWHASTDTTRFGANDIPGNQSVRGMLLRSALPDSAVGPVWLVVALLLVAAGTYGAWTLERQGRWLAAIGVLASLSVAVSPISWVHHLVWLTFPLAALAAAGRWRLVVGWYLLLLPGLPAAGAAAARADALPPVLAHLVIDLQGLSAVAAVLLLPVLVLTAAPGAQLRPGRLPGPSRQAVAPGRTPTQS